MCSQNNDKHDLENIKEFYDNKYYDQKNDLNKIPSHYKRLAKSLKISPTQKILDVACGTGEWLKACNDNGANVYGVDLSEKAINLCGKRIPQGNFYQHSAEELPFEDESFNLVSCLGALEHFVDPEKALKEIVRVAQKEAKILLLVPNANFLTRRLKLFAGTYQVEAKEEVLSLQEWKEFFESSGLKIDSIWKDLHVLSWAWISIGKWYQMPLRALQAIALAFWPLNWQYQLYYLCYK